MLKDNLQAVLTMAEKNFQLFGNLATVFLLMVENEVVVEQVCFRTIQDKEDFSNKLKTLISQRRLTEFIMITEAWCADARTVQREEYKGSLEHYHGRKEIAIVSYYSPKEEIDFTADIIRDTIPSLSKWIRTERQILSAASIVHNPRFQNLFLKSKVSEN